MIRNLIIKLVNLLEFIVLYFASDAKHREDVSQVFDVILSEKSTFKLAADAYIWWMLCFLTAAFMAVVMITTAPFAIWKWAKPRITSLGGYGAATILVFVLAVTLLLAGCAAPTRGTFCDVAKPIRPTAAEVADMSDASVTATLEHNRKGAALCGWKP